MNDDKRTLQGSSWRDRFKRAHKAISPRFYAADADLMLVEKDPPGIAALVDYKHPNDRITFAEIIAYNALAPYVPVYIVTGFPEGPFDVFRYLGGDPRPDPPTVRLELVRTCRDWRDFEDWERALRRAYRRRSCL